MKAFPILGRDVGGSTDYCVSCRFSGRCVDAGAAVVGSMLSATAGVEPEFRRRRLLWLIAPPVMLLLAWLAMVTPVDGEPMSGVWGIFPVGVCWFATVWQPSRSRVRDQVLTAAVMALCLGGMWWWGDFHRDEIVSLVLANIFQAWLFCWLYRRFAPGWAPRTPVHLLHLVLAGVVSSAVALPLGAGPGFALDAPWEIWSGWVVRNLVSCFTAVACFLPLWLGRPRRAASLWWIPEWLVVTLAALAAYVFVFDGRQEPFTWVLMLPAIWAGMRMNPWTASLHSFVAVVAASFAATRSLDRFTDTWMDPVSTFNLLSLVYCLVVMLLVLLREQRTLLLREVIHERAMSEEQSRMLEELLQEVSDGVVLLDTEGRVEFSNGPARVLLPQVVGEHASEWIDHLVPVAGELTQDDAVRWQEMVSGELRTFRLKSHGVAEGRVVDAWTNPARIRGQDRLVLVMRDVTSQQHLLAELREFAAIAAHDLRSPVTALDGWLEVAEGADRLDEVHHAVRRGRVMAKRMDREIEEWLSYTVVRRGRLTPQQIDLAQMVAELQASHPQDSIRAEGSLPVVADPALVRQLLGNLVGNAVKFAANGAADVTVSGRVVRPGWRQIDVADRGVVISAEEAQVIFDPFRRGSTGDREIRGLGMGLALCHRVVHRHGGEIWVGPHVGDEGATIGNVFSFTLPAGGKALGLR